MQPIILASSSLYRRAILDKIQLSYHCQSPKIDEKPLNDENSVDLVRRLAAAKAYKVAKTQSDACFIIGSDQVACLDGEILSKPHTVENACRQLQKCSGKKVTFHTGLCLLDTAEQSIQLDCVPFSVYFRELTHREIERYIALEKPLDCAGSFKAEGLGISLFDKLEGDDFNTLIGLPLIPLLAMLRNKGINPLAS